MSRSLPIPITIKITENPASRKKPEEVSLPPGGEIRKKKSRLCERATGGLSVFVKYFTHTAVHCLTTVTKSQRKLKKNYLEKREIFADVAVNVQGLFLQASFRRRAAPSVSHVAKPERKMQTHPG